MKRQLRALFSGSVQGVGFRFTTERIARQFPVAGFVRNLPGGKVELVAEGEERSVKEFLGAVQEAFREYIRSVDTRWGNPSSGYEGFGIKF